MGQLMAGLRFTLLFFFLFTKTNDQNPIIWLLVVQARDLKPAFPAGVSCVFSLTRCP